MEPIKVQIIMKQINKRKQTLIKKIEALENLEIELQEKCQHFYVIRKERNGQEIWKCPYCGKIKTINHKTKNT